jgi:hypothetical protein
LAACFTFVLTARVAAGGVEVVEGGDDVTGRGAGLGALDVVTLGVVVLVVVVLAAVGLGVGAGAFFFLVVVGAGEGAGAGSGLGAVVDGVVVDGCVIVDSVGGSSAKAGATRIVDAAPSTNRIASTQACATRTRFVSFRPLTAATPHAWSQS